MVGLRLRVVFSSDPWIIFYPQQGLNIYSFEEEGRIKCLAFIKSVHVMVWRFCKNPWFLILGTIWATLILKCHLSDDEFGHEIMKYLCQQSNKCITQLWRNQKQSAWSQSPGCLKHPPASYQRTMIAGLLNLRSLDVERGPLCVIWAPVSTMQISAIIPEPWQKGFR